MMALNPRIPKFNSFKWKNIYIRQVAQIRDPGCIMKTFWEGEWLSGEKYFDQRLQFKKPGQLFATIKPANVCVQ